MGLFSSSNRSENEVFVEVTSSPVIDIDTSPFGDAVGEFGEAFSEVGGAIERSVTKTVKAAGFGFVLWLAVKILRP